MPRRTSRPGPPTPPEPTGIILSGDGGGGTSVYRPPQVTTGRYDATAIEVTCEIWLRTCR